MKAIAWEYPYFWQPSFKKNSKYLKNGEAYKISTTNKRDRNLISYLECAIRFNVSSTIIILFQFKKKYTKKQKKIKKNLENGEFDEKSEQNIKDVKHDFT